MEGKRTKSDLTRREWWLMGSNVLLMVPAYTIPLVGHNGRCTSEFHDVDVVGNMKSPNPAFHDITPFS